MVARNTIILCLSMLIGGFISVYFGKELNWDLANYHYYNPYYFLHQRWNIDYWPYANIHVHYTPTLDFLTYFLINHLSPKATTFIMGALHGINFWLLFCIARLCLKTFTKTQPLTLSALVISLLGVYGPTALPGIGSFQHDNLVSLFVLGFIFLQLTCLVRYAETKQWSYGLLLSASVLLGIGVGCKLTAGLFVGANGVAFLLLPLPWRSRIKLMAVFASGVALGMLLSSGYWMLFLWQTYHNPFFPLWNGIFGSSDFPLYNWRDTRFLPKGWLQHWFFPFYFSLDGRTSDASFRDFRFATVYIMVVVSALFAIKTKIQEKVWPPLSLALLWLLMFFIFSYVLWQCYFSIMRYIVVLEMLAPLIIYLLLYVCLRDALVRLALVAFIFWFIASTMIPAAMIRARWYDTDYFNVTLPSYVKEHPKATVLVAFPAYALHINPRPQSYLIPFFPAGWRFMGIPFPQDNYTIPPAIYALVKHEKSLYLLASPAYMPKMVNTARKLGFPYQGTCSFITSDRQRMTNEAMLLCLAKK